MAAVLRIGPGRYSLRDGDRVFRLEWDGFTLHAGRPVALTGASGSGKTLLLELLGLLRAPGPGMSYAWESGDGQAVRDLAALWAHGPRHGALGAMRGRLFGFVPQTGGLMPFLTVAENIALPQRVTGREDAPWYGELAARLGLEGVAGMRPAALSIGQRQRVAVARALAHRPDFVIADEPTGALDPETADKVLELLLDIARARNCGVILSSHDLDRIGRFAIPRLGLRTAAGPGGAVVSRLEACPC